MVAVVIFMNNLAYKKNENIFNNNEFCCHILSIQLTIMYKNVFNIKIYLYQIEGEHIFLLFVFFTINAIKVIPFSFVFFTLFIFYDINNNVEALINRFNTMILIHYFLFILYIIFL